MCKNKSSTAHHEKFKRELSLITAKLEFFCFLHLSRLFCGDLYADSVDSYSHLFPMIVSMCVCVVSFRCLPLTHTYVMIEAFFFTVAMQFSIPFSHMMIAVVRVCLCMTHRFDVIHNKLIALLVE